MDNREKQLIDSIIAASELATINPENAHPAIPTVFVDPAASEPAHRDNAASPSLDERIAAARAKLLVPAQSAPTGGKLEAPDAELVNTLLAEASEHERLAKLHTVDREKIKDFFKDLITTAEDSSGAPIEELTVHGATVFTFKTVEARGLDQSYLKSLFPDIPANSEAWTTTTSRRALFK